MRDKVNFSAGPASIPTAALERARDELLDYGGVGASIMELSHRGPEYGAVHEEALAMVTELLAVPNSHKVIFLQGGATGMFGLIPLNFLNKERSAEFVLTGVWSEKAVKAADCIGEARIVGTGRVGDAYIRVPSQEELDLSPEATYLHITSNNTIAGTQYHDFPDSKGVPLIVDMSSDILSKPIDVSKFDLIYAGAQKNLGPSGVVLVVASKKILERVSNNIPEIFKISAHAQANSLLHTPPTFSIYMVRNVLNWIVDQGGLESMAQRNQEKARILYEAIDTSHGFYISPVEKKARSEMNVVFKLERPELEARFLSEAKQHGLIGLKGHRSVGGIRASIYNAISVEGTGRLVEFMNRFRAAV